MKLVMNTRFRNYKKAIRLTNWINDIPLGDAVRLRDRIMKKVRSGCTAYYVLKENQYKGK